MSGVSQENIRHFAVKRARDSSVLRARDPAASESLNCLSRRLAARWEVGGLFATLKRIRCCDPHRTQRDCLPTD